jgi:hypothetical protein
MDQEVKSEDQTYTFSGTGRVASEWQDIFAKEGKHSISDWAIRAISGIDYDAKHRLARGRKYKVRLLFMRDIADASRRSIEEMNKFAAHLCGKKASVGLKAELVFLLRERFTNQDLRELNISRIIVPHPPLYTYGDELCWLRVDGFDKGSNVGTENVEPGSAWDDQAAFAYLV